MKAQIQNLGAFLVKLRMKLKGSEQTKQDEILGLFYFGSQKSHDPVASSSGNSSQATSTMSSCPTQIGYILHPPKAV